MRIGSASENLSPGYVLLATAHASTVIAEADVGAPCTGAPGAGAPCTGAPGTGAPGAGAPGSHQQGRRKGLKDCIMLHVPS
jgi:hypothetical protein